MSWTLRLAVGATFALVGTGVAGDSIRLAARPADPADIHRLDLKSSDDTASDVVRTGWYVGVGVRYYGGFGYAYPAPLAYYPYYRAPIVSYYGAPAFSYSYAYRPYCCCCCAPRVDYYPPVVRVRPLPPPVFVATEFPGGDSLSEPRTFRYDGGPAGATRSERIPPAQDAAPPVPKLPEPPAIPKLGPAPQERKISFPAQTAPNKYEYPAYGADRLAPSDGKSLLIRR